MKKYHELGTAMNVLPLNEIGALAHAEPAVRAL